MRRREHRQEPRGPRHLGRDGHERRDRARPAKSPRSGWTATSTRPRSSPSSGVPLSSCNTLVTRLRQRRRRSPAASTRAPSTSARASIPTARNGRSPTSRSSSAPARAPIRTTRSRSTDSLVEDIDGDGRILQMRIPDPNGAWKVAPEEPRLMVRREPDETGGAVLPHAAGGPLRGLRRRHDHDAAADRQRLDLNRNFPALWRQEFEQHGAGPYPDLGAGGARAWSTSSRAHPNITGGVDASTPARGVLLRPFEHQTDEEMPPRTCGPTRRSATKGTELTGYPGDLGLPRLQATTRKRSSPARFDDWIYDHLGRLRLDGGDLERRSARPASPTTSSSTGSASIRSRTT